MDINILNQDEKVVTIVEEKKYTADRTTIQNQLYNIQHQKATLIEQSKRIKEEFDVLTNQENKLKEVLAEWEKDDIKEVIELGV